MALEEQRLGHTGVPEPEVRHDETEDIRDGEAQYPAHDQDLDARLHRDRMVAAALALVKRAWTKAGRSRRLRPFTACGPSDRSGGDRTMRKILVLAATLGALAAACGTSNPSTQPSGSASGNAE